MKVIGETIKNFWTKKWTDLDWFCALVVIPAASLIVVFFLLLYAALWLKLPIVAFIPTAWVAVVIFIIYLIGTKGN